MSTWVIIPVKPLNRAKSRLTAVLTPEQRRQLAESMFRHVLEVVRDVPQVIGTLVISRDSKALSIARDYDAKTVQETGTPELNSALMRATQVVASWWVESVLVLPADLPLVTSDDIVSMIRLGEGIPSVVIATDQNRDGTNALFMRPPGVIPYAYGPGSYQRHVAYAREAHIDVKSYYSEQLALDIDVSSDLDTYKRLARQTNFQQLFVSD
ncbi:MAG: 2-phospho-L-lactate guanylyltransferase [Anaerolineae bacterium]|nr:2-phospho-L-lactate guanylyltransferase [Anaerolineae bacterium]